MWYVPPTKTGCTPYKNGTYPLKGTPPKLPLPKSTFSCTTFFRKSLKTCINTGFPHAWGWCYVMYHPHVPPCTTKIHKPLILLGFLEKRWYIAYVPLLCTTFCTTSPPYVPPKQKNKIIIKIEDFLKFF